MSLLSFPFRRATSARGTPRGQSYWKLQEAPGRSWKVLVWTSRTRIRRSRGRSWSRPSTTSKTVVISVNVYCTVLYCTVLPCTVREAGGRGLHSTSDNPSPFFCLAYLLPRASSALSLLSFPFRRATSARGTPRGQSYWKLQGGPGGSWKVLDRTSRSRIKRARARSWSRPSTTSRTGVISVITFTL